MISQYIICKHNAPLLKCHLVQISGQDHLAGKATFKKKTLTGELQKEQIRREGGLERGEVVPHRILPFIAVYRYILIFSSSLR